MVCGNFCKMNGSGDISNFGVFTVLKIVLHNKSINETRLKKMKKILHHFGDQYLANHLIKFLQ